MKIVALLLLTLILFCDLSLSAPVKHNSSAFIAPLSGLNKSFSFPKQPVSKKVKKAEAKNAEIQEKQEKAYETAKAEDMKHRMDLQSPKTRERMKENRKIAEKNNDHYHKSFWGKIWGN